MGASVELLPLTTIEGEGADPLYQDVGETIDTSRYESGVVTSRVLQVETDTPGTYDLTFTVQGSDDGESWSTIMSFTAPGEDTKYLNRSQQPEQGEYLWRYVRWILTPSTGTTDWKFCGRVTVVLK